MDSSTSSTRWLAATARLSFVVLLVFCFSYVWHASKDFTSTTASMAAYGGATWCFKCENGWNWHVILLTGFTLAMAESALAFRAPLFDCGGKASRKWTHLFWQFAAVVFMIVGMVAIVQSKDDGGYPDMYSVHSWTGSAVLVLFAAQFVIGVVAFALFKARIPPATLAAIARWHSFAGKLTLFGGIGACVNGWADMQMMNVDFGQRKYKAATMLGSASALMYWVLGAVMCCLLFGTTVTPTMPKPAAAPADSTEAATSKDVAIGNMKAPSSEV